jgi:hypothetical protein
VDGQVSDNETRTTHCGEEAEEKKEKQGRG